MAADRLEIYNGALLLCGDRKLASLTENREPRHLLDDVWNGGRGVRYCLEQGQWHFAMRASRFDYDASATPEFGFTYGFAKPTDWVATSGIFQDERCVTPLLQYADEVSYWFADNTEIFVKYVSDGAAFGMDFAKWPETFTEYVKAFFASKIIHRLPGGAEKADAILHHRSGLLAHALLIAKNKSAMTQPATFPNRGTWAAARHGGLSGRRDGGNTSQLIG